MYTILLYIYLYIISIFFFKFCSLKEKESYNFLLNIINFKEFFQVVSEKKNVIRASKIALKMTISY